MSIAEAIEHLIQSESFKQKAKAKDRIGGKYRMFLTRYKKGEIKSGVAIDFLLNHGYRIEVKKPTKAA